MTPEELFEDFLKGIPSFKELEPEVQGVARSFFFGGLVWAETKKESQSERSESRAVAR